MSSKNITTGFLVAKEQMNEHRVFLNRWTASLDPTCNTGFWGPEFKVSGKALNVHI